MVKFSLRRLKKSRLVYIGLHALWKPGQAQYIMGMINRRHLLGMKLKEAYHHAHHVITIESAKSCKSVQMAILRGFDLNSVANGKPVWYKYHHFFHTAKYNEWQLGEIKKWEASKGHIFTGEEAYKFISKDLREESIRKMEEILEYKAKQYKVRKTTI